MNEKLLDTATQYVESMAKALGVAAEHVYTILVRQQIAEGVAGLTISIILLVLGLIAVKSFMKATKPKAEKLKQERWYVTSLTEDVMIFLRYVLPVIYVILVIICVVAIPFDIVKLINPEYYAIKDILDVFKGSPE